MELTRIWLRERHVQVDCVDPLTFELLQDRIKQGGPNAFLPMLYVHRHKIQIAHSFCLPTHQNLLWYSFLFVSRCESENIPAVVFGYEEIVFVSFIDHLDIRHGWHRVE